MKICVVGDGILFDEFKTLYFITLDSDILSVDLSKELNDFDTIINCYDRSDDGTLSLSGVYVYNAAVPHELSNFCKKTGKKLVHISTGDIYENSHKLQSETETPSVKNAYEASKLLGESYIDKEYNLIIRTKNIFNDSISKKNELYNLITKPSNIDIPISFSYTLDIIRSITKLLKEKQCGVFNVTSEGLVSPFKIAPVADYLKKQTILELNPKKNIVQCLNIEKLLQFHTPDETEEQMLDCIGRILKKLED